ncbi:MAG: FeoB-associated Cys-rich membrane protein [Clostridia bacterium]|nr:FeoB-associated Cys-rich membrane protein [Clostridia bacterium]
MFHAIAENAGTIVVTLVLVGIVAAILVKMRKDKKQGKSSCGCSCGSCPMSGACHKQ